MINSIHFARKARLLAAVAPFAMTLVASPAFAQDANVTSTAPAPTTVAPDTPDTPDATAGNDIVVTGTLFRNQSTTNIASPVSVLSASDLEKRGVSTVQQAIQSLASNGGPALTNSFSANGAFAGGASGASLRGLSTNSTLILFDGLRASYYPLADDGSRNFVDLNTIPDEVVDRVEVLRDGASSSYGADAIAGVINIITKKQITGITATAEAGITEKGDAANQRVSLTAGFGDLSTQNFNIYASGHYLHQDALFSRDRGFPYNTDNQIPLCANAPVPDACADNRQNSPINFAGVSSIVPVFLVRPADATNTTPLGRYQFLNPATGCGDLPTYRLSDDEYNAFTNAPRTVCTQDTTNATGVIEPEITRLGGTVRASLNIGGDTHAYAEFNFEQSTVSYTGYGLAGPGLPTNSLIRANGPAGIIYPRFSTSSNAATNAPGSLILALPVYICPASTAGACNAANGTLNPNNPFAADNEVARIIGTLPDLSQYSQSRSRVYRLALGLDGSFGNSWNYQVNAVGNYTNLRRHYEGYVYIQHLLDEVKDGSYNFVNPELNSQAVLNYLAPALNNYDNSELYQVDANLGHDFFQLPGGPFEVAVGGSVRYESVYAPSGNPDYNGPTERYFVLNAFGTVGHRYVESGYFQAKAPIIDQITIEGSGRYDHYSTGQSNFSPKGGIVINPIHQLTLRGTISGGFRIPSFGESSSLPTTGYTPYAIGNFPDAYLAQFSNAGVTCSASAPNNCSAYVNAASIGLRSIANPNLQPEKSRNITLGAEFRPVKALTLTADYYNIRKTGAIISSPSADVLAAYYANPAGYTPPAGYSLEFNAPDINHPDAAPTVSVIGSPYINATTIETEGVDFGADLRLPLGNGWRFTSSAEAEYIIKLNTTYPDGHTDHYAGTLGNYALTAGTGTQKWKGTWQNTLEFGDLGSLSLTAYYIDGYNLSAADSQPTPYMPCTDPTGGANGDMGGLDAGIQGCRVHSFIDVDMTGSINVNDRFTFYVNVLNVFGAHAPLDTVTYGGYLYNPVAAEAGVVGRAFRAGVKARF